MQDRGSTWCARGGSPSTVLRSRAAVRDGSEAQEGPRRVGRAGPVQAVLVSSR